MQIKTSAVLHGRVGKFDLAPDKNWAIEHKASEIYEDDNFLVCGNFVIVCFVHLKLSTKWNLSFCFTYLVIGYSIKIIFSVT